MAHGIRMGVRGSKGSSYVERQSLDGGPIERHSVHSCRHCQRQMHDTATKKVLGGHTIGGYCPHCNSPLCADCEKRRLNAASSREACRPFAEVLERSIKVRAQRQALGL